MVALPAKKTPAPANAAVATQKKSGLKTFNAGDIIFNENDNADSLYIIQTGQIRLFLPKGRGFVDIAILRAGEVIGEMAYFDETSRKRSCSASAIVTTQVVEISFIAFEKTMASLNPWFKTIINTLATRLRKTNSKVKELESASVAFGKDGKVADYKFIHSTDITKFLSILYLGMKTHGELKGGAIQLHLDKIKFYAFDIFNYPEIKFEELIHLLVTNGQMSLENDPTGLPKILQVNDLELLRKFLLFFNTQRLTADDKKLKISDKCEKLLKKILEQLASKNIKIEKTAANLSIIFEEFKAKNVPITNEDLADAIKAGFCGDIMIGTGNVMSVDVSYEKLKQTFPSIKVMNAINKLNESKAHAHY